MKQASNIAKVGLLLLAVLFILASTSCQSNHQVVKSRTQKYYDKVVQHKQFAIVNNQIIIFENN